MKLNDIFAKDVQRPIEGVIKADDASHLAIEIDEYVLTNEAAKGLEQLLEEYVNYTNANGVWISGFFGSGKSHMLKMLAHLLGDVQDQMYPRQSVSEAFLKKATDAFLPPLLQKAAAIPAKSLLFNIDQKATLISKDQTDALLKVFVKVFDNSRGYYGNQGHVARFERDLDKRGQYGSFKDAYQRIAGRAWEQGREEGILEEVNVAKAYAEVNGESGGSPANILSKYRSDYEVSIEDFADEVHAWLETQEPGFRLNFFVDEVGQFIGSDTHLMLNLQTIAESLNTKCNGRAWVMVTSQEDMDKVVGDRTKQQGNDFSKIQARFKTRLKLTSADVEEVIRKRLLQKNASGETALEAIYKNESGNFRTIFDFVDGAKTYRNFTDEAHFVGTYPFVTYQFPLFQAAIEGISDHNVFEGRNSSVGERSMLGVVQQVAKDIGNVEVGTLATFDQMFAGIRASLKSASQRQIDVAERNLGNKLAIKLLKALFLVKYVEGFHATARNLSVLVYDRFGLDLPALQKHVQEALALLEVETYVQRNGNLYEYLTNDEQVIEEEIKNVELDASEVSQRLFKFLSAEVVKVNKVRYAKNGQDFPFGFRLDDDYQGQTKELTLHFISDAYPHPLETIKAHSANLDELRVVMQGDDRLLSDLRLLLKTEKYTRLKRSGTLSAAEQRILDSKAAFNTERAKELVERIKAAIGQSTLVINAVEVTATSTDAVGRVTEGFQDLIARTYKQLSILGGITYAEAHIGPAANPDSTTLFTDSDISKLEDAAVEILSHIRQQQTQSASVSVKSLIDRFEAKPYGWSLSAIQVAIARLMGTARITLTLDSNVVKRSETAGVLRNTQKHAQTIVKIQQTFDEARVRRVKEFAAGFFDDGAAPSDPLELARSVKDRLGAKHHELSAILTASSSNYPFIVELNEPIELLATVIGKPDEWYLTDFDANADALLDAKENSIDPIETFLTGAQRTVFDDAVKLLTANANNLAFLSAGTGEEVQRLLDSPTLFRGSGTQKLKAAADALRAIVAAAVEAIRFQEIAAIDGRRKELIQSADHERATDAAREEVRRRIEQIAGSLRNESQIALIKQIGSDFDVRIYPELFDVLLASVVVPADLPVPADPTDSGQVATVIPPASLSIKTIKVGFNRALLETPDDVNDYVEAFRAELLGVITDGKRITL